MNIKLEKPLCSIDFETTVTDQNPNKPDPGLDRIVEIGIKKITNGVETKYHLRVNPGIPIHPNSTEVHGITDADVVGKPKFVEIAQEVLDFISGCDLVGYNILRYDAPLLLTEFSRAGIQWDYSKARFIDALRIARRREKRDLTWAMKFYCDEDHAEAHGAMADAEAALKVLLAQSVRYEDLPTDIDGLARYSNDDSPLLDLSGKFKYNDNGEVVFAFGKHQDWPAKNQPDYLYWMLNADFPSDTKAIARELLGFK